MNKRLTYKLWQTNSKDHRYLRPKRWDEIKKAIDEYKPKNILEFGAGVSTLLFSNLGLNLTSLETDEAYLNFVKGLCPNKVNYILWDGKKVPLKGYFDLILVDGALPRIPQLVYAVGHTDLIAVDDFAGSIEKSFLPYLIDFKRVNSETIMAIFRSFKKLTNYDT